MKIIVILIFLMTLCARADYLLIAARDAGGWQIACFDIDYQFNETPSHVLLTSIHNQNNPTTLQQSINVLLDKPLDWVSIPVFDSMDLLLEVKAEITNKPENLLEVWEIEE